MAAAAVAAVCLAAATPDSAGDPNLRIPQVAYPSLPARAASEAVYRPAGWRVEKRLSGDLDGDSRPDLVLVLRGADHRCVVRHNGLGVSPLDTNPRLLVVIIAEPGGYRLVGANHDIIPRSTNPVVEDALAEGGIALVKGALRVELGFFASAGSYGVVRATFTFRWRGGSLALVGFDRMEFSRSTHESRTWSYNYLTGRAKITHQADEESPETVRWTSLRKARLVGFQEVGDPWSFGI